ncbi:MAG TPA: SpoIVB peptidase S55 domain-containing protein, partial [Terriglobia bacterium]|nr:SpoIVB peptidase S55 domain-containing protein [Terriglobia bacterium]
MILSAFARAPRRRAGTALFCVAALLAASVAPSAQEFPASPGRGLSTPIMPLSEVRAGMRGVGKTVFTGEQIEEFQAEILGVLRNVTPRQSLIMARLSGGPLEQTGVLAGMSGSPVYVEGRLIGAVSMTFQFIKEPIAGITPIEQMLEAATAPAPAPPRRQAAAWNFVRDS